MLTDLNNFDLIAVTGADAATFLQGQLTGNIDHVTPEKSLVAAYCDINGRIISDMRVIGMNGSLYLLCARGMGYALKKILDKYIVFSKASTRVETSQYQRYGVYGQSAKETVLSLFGSAPENQGQVLQIEGGVVYRLPDTEPRYEVLISVDQDETLEKLEDFGVTDDLEEWELADVRQGIVHITPAIQDTYTPQLLNYDLNGTIDFKKGCYTGQEIVARMYYRATAKKRLYRIAVNGIRASLDSTVIHKSEVVGEIVSVARTENGAYELLAILPCELVDQKVTLELCNEPGDSAGDRQNKVAAQILTLPDLVTQEPSK
ncbi:MAG: hypothetical protein Q7V56_05450 [Gammaproteobacteria bacterium]|nr:hypothetical protein [Gammaproteobacteria bacterium]